MKFKRTVKKSTQYTKNNGNINNTVINHTKGLMDSVKVTKKQTTINSQNNGYIKGGLDNPTLGYEQPGLNYKRYYIILSHWYWWWKCIGSYGNR